MKNPLLSLDEIISKQFAKVANIAEKRFGLDRSDLASITEKILGISSIGMGTFAFIRGYFAERIFDVSAAAIILTLGGYALHNSMQSKKRTIEIYNDKRDSSASRPIILAFFPLLFFNGIKYITKGTTMVPEYYSKIELSDYNKLTGLIHLFASIFGFSFVSYYYFRTQKTPQKEK